MTKRACVFVFMLLISVPGIFAQPANCQAVSGTTTRETYPSAILGQTMYYTVYTPPCYDATTNYPTVYLMHGSNDNDEHWLRLGLGDALDAMILAGDAPPMIAVLPFGNVIANRNRFDTVSWANIFRDELMPDAASKYAVATTRENRAIGGISRGGFWAYQIAFSDTALFSAVGGHSAFFDLYHAPPEHNPLDLALSDPTVASLRIWLDRGADDYAAPGLDIMAQRLQTANIDHTYRIYDQGQHNNTYWSSHIEEYLRFYVDQWQPSSGQNAQSAAPTPAPVSGFATNTPEAPTGFATAQPTLMPTIALNDDGQAATVFYPVAAFPSLRTSIPLERLQQIAEGTLAEELVLTQSTSQAMRAAGYGLHPETATVPDAALRDTLWQNRDLFTLLRIQDFDLDLRLLWMDDIPVSAQLAYYPFTDGTTVDHTRFTLSGVTAVTRRSAPAIDANGVEWLASGVEPYVKLSDFFHMSNEVSTVPGCPQSNGVLLGGSFSFCTKPDHMELFNLLDVDIIELSGNHNNDYGYDAYRETLAFYRENGIQTVGGGETLAEARLPLIQEHHGNTIAILSCNAVGPYYALVNEDAGLLGGVRPGAASCDWDWLERVIPDLAQYVDVLIVTVQHLEVEDYLPIDSHRFDFRRMADLGADVILNTASHKPQTYEFYRASGGRRTLIHYGMGNLFFDQPWWGNMRFFMNTLIIHDGELRAVEMFPGIIEELARPRLMTPEERENFLFFMLREKNGF